MNFLSLCVEHCIITNILSLYTGQQYTFYNGFVYAQADTFYQQIKNFAPTYFLITQGRSATQSDIEERIKSFTEKYNNLFDKIVEEISTVLALSPSEEFFQKLDRIIRDGTFTDAKLKDGSWKKDMMFKHLEMHKYAHNGVNNLSTITIDNTETTIFQFVKENLIIDDDWNLYHFVHSLLHAYDSVHMKRDTEFVNDRTYIQNTMALMPEQQSECLKKNINKYALDFLAKDADGNLLTPLKIIDEALPDKQRQYAGSPSQLLYDLEPQVDGKSPLPTTGNIPAHPNNASIP